MPKLAGRDVKPFKVTDNAKFLNAIRGSLSPDYRSRVSVATQANIEKVMDEIFSFGGPRNEFISGLVNVGEKWASGVNFSNPLSKYKRTALTHGDRIEQTQIGLAKSYGYSFDRDYMERDLFGREPLETMLAVHKIARQEWYKVTIDELALKRAFLEPGGLSSFVQEMMSVPAVSDEVDEFEAMVALYRAYYDRNGFFIVNVPDVSDLDSDAAQARALTRRVRAYASNLRYVSRNYNSARMPVAAKPETLVLITTPEAQAAIDVEALAAAFNMEKAEMPFRTEIIPADKLNIPGVQAILTTEDFLIVADTAYETRVINNGVGLYENHVLHHHQILSVNPFVPAILFSSTDESTVIDAALDPVTGISPVEVHDLFSINPQQAITVLERGKLYQVTGSAVRTPEDILRDGVKLSMSGATSALTYLRQDGAFHAGPDEKAESITITAETLGGEETFTGSVTVTFTDDIVEWGLTRGGAEEPVDPDPDPEV